jgi:hypothetical protein
MNRTVAIFILSVALSAVMSPSARADVLYLSGAEHGSNSSYAFVGSIIPLPGNTLGSGFAVRLWGDYLAYDYKSGTTTIEGSGWGGEVAGVYQFSGAWGWSNLSLGTRYRDTKYHPDDLSNRARGGHVNFTLQGDGGYNIDASWRLRGIASYTSTVTGYFVQPGVDRAVSNTVRIGLDATFQGDKSYKQVSGGANVSIAIDDRKSLGLRAGASTSAAGTGLYAGLSFILTGT